VQFGTPPPVRPEPQPPAAIQPSRTALEARNSRSGRPVVPPASGNFPGTGLVNSAPASQTSPRPAEAIREPSGTREGRVIPQASNRSTPVPPSIIRPTTPSPARSEVVQGGFGAERPVASQPARSPDLSGGARNIPGAGLPGSMRPAAPNTVTPSAPAQRLEAINTPRNSMDIYRQTTRSQAPVSTPLHIQQNTPARSPDLVRPQTPSVPSGAGPSAVRPQPAPQSSVTVSPQPINPSAGGWNAPTPAGSPNIIRSETFGGRPVQAPVQTAPVIQSREMTPVAPRSIPVPQPSVSGGGVSQQALPGQFRAPPVNTAPAVNPAPAAGGRFNAAPVPAGRPAVIQSAPAQSSAPREGGRGRLEIGR
jgi:hypothetical protein